MSEKSTIFLNILNGSSLIYVVLMGIIFFNEVSGKKGTNFLKLYTGILSIVYGVAILAFLISLSSDYFSTYEKFKFFIGFFILVVLICIWIILFGIHDLRNRKMT
ncbi:hypothetical protein [Dokdonia sp.]|uniref:hypothetical protein n=1 Tax=Dokdonia sp. TaxID=2024995 RepID=UPI003264ABD2